MKTSKAKLKGSVTVEASLVLPLFLIFIIQVYSLFEILTIYTKLQAACEETAVEAATVLALPEEAKQSELSSFLFSETLVREEIIRKARLGDSADSVILGGLGGLHLFRSDLATDGENVEIIVTYRVKPRLSPSILGTMTLVNHSKVRAWTGYEKAESGEGSGQQEESGETVYVTASGEAYHLYEDCTILRAKVEKVSGKELGNKRSEDRNIYYPCEFCCGSEKVEAEKNYYITPWGARFHTDPSCNALKKRYTAISIGDVGNRHLCSVCRKRRDAEE